MAFKSTARPVNLRQNSKPELLAFRLDVSAVVDTTNAGLDEGANYATVSKTGTGDYTITLNRKARRTLVVVGAVAFGEGFVRLVSGATDDESVRFIIEDDAGTATDFDVHITLLAFYGETER